MALSGTVKLNDDFKQLRVQRTENQFRNSISSPEYLTIKYIVAIEIILMYLLHKVACIYKNVRYLVINLLLESLITMESCMINSSMVASTTVTAGCCMRLNFIF